MSPPLVVALSGGVDSSVAAALLRRQGQPLVGVTLQLQDCQDARASRSCCGVDGLTRARAVAGALGIPHFVVNCVREFEAEVLRPAWEAYACGRTPSPCLRCNERIKFGLLLSWARTIGAAGVATGHYARVEAGPAGAPVLRRGADREKDQSYFLAGLDADQLKAVRLPLGGLCKAEVREQARALGLASADAPDSQDACLVGPDQSFAEMLRERFGALARPGPIVDTAGRLLGRHPGVHHFTVGQRKGLGLPSPARRWVKAIRSGSAEVVICDHERDLFAPALTAREVSWIGPPLSSGPRRCQVQIRYRHAPAAASVERVGTALRVIFDQPVRAVTPGQAAVFYDQDRVLGRGWIDDAG